MARWRALIADDSPVTCRLLAGYLQASGEFEIVGTAHDGADAAEKCRTLGPDLLLLDIDMPQVDGMEALDRVMHECPSPVLLISGASRRAAQNALRGLELGAVDVVLKYRPDADLDPESFGADLIARARAAARVRVVRSLRRSRVRPAPPSPRNHTGETAQAVVVIGASTGGPVAVRELLAELPGDFQPGVLIVQHLPVRFTALFADQLAASLRRSVREASDGDVVSPGSMYVAPSGVHLLAGRGGRLRTCSADGEETFCPEIDRTMASAAQVWGARTCGVLLSGMGRDGAKGLAAIRGRAGRCLAQTPEHCLIGAMPEAALEAGVVDEVAGPRGLAALVRGWAEGLEIAA